MTPEDATALIGTTVPTLPPTRSLREGGLWHDADTGEAVLGIYPCEELPTLRQAILSVRSEEHTSELQSLMRISYAVFCLKKKKTTITKQNYKTYSKT